MESFLVRHLGPRDHDIQKMLEFLDLKSLDQLTSLVLPNAIQSKSPLQLGPVRSEFEVLAELKEIASRNRIHRSLIGMGYSQSITPGVIQRNIFENPGWYTQYTPYQAEIAQGRLEALLNFQTMVADLTGLPVANASLLDEGTAAAEAMGMCFALKGKDTARSFFVSKDCHPQTIALVQTRAEPLGVEVVIGDPQKFDWTVPVFGVLLQYPATEGTIYDYRRFVEKAHELGALVTVAADILSLALLTPPGEWGADIVVGNTQRFGVPLGYGGPHAAYFATRDEFKRQIPGRIVGVSRDVDGKPAIRLALQTREQHIRRDKATSNICTAQVLLAIMASMYAVYHGPEGIKKIAEEIHHLTLALAKGFKKLGFRVCDGPYFDTLQVDVGESLLNAIIHGAHQKQFNLRILNSRTLGISLDEASSRQEVKMLLELFAQASHQEVHFSSEELEEIFESTQEVIPSDFLRKSAYLTHPVFNSYHSETEMLRYISRLQAKDLSLAHSMIPLGSCTMKLNATSEMLPVTWPEFSNIHPFAPAQQTMGYQVMLTQLEKMLQEITGFSAVSLQPNAGSQGEYAGLLVIRKYHLSRGDQQRNVCLIPKSAHGTNPASAVMAGMKVVVVDCDKMGNIDLVDLEKKAKENHPYLAAVMITYPSTHGVFEEEIKKICQIIHENGGQVYMDGANMNAQIGLCRPGDFGADVCHLNLHKTFCIPHGGGGPGMGPIAVAEHLAGYLPGQRDGIGPVSSVTYGSPSILTISWMYISMMGAVGLKKATQVAILNANYIARQLDSYYPVLYRGVRGYVAHECIFDLRQLKETTGVEVEDVAKRLMDYGFHAPTISFPVPGTLMVEPTESESLAEMDRFCEAMILIRKEIEEIEKGKADRQNNLLKNAPHTAEQIAKDDWERPYSRERAAFPAASLRDRKFWPSVGRINNVLGDRTLICSCPTPEEYV